MGWPWNLLLLGSVVATAHITDASAAQLDQEAPGRMRPTRRHEFDAFGSSYWPRGSRAGEMNMARRRQPPWVRTLGQGTAAWHLSAPKGTYNVIDYGADPTGVRDSWQAIQKAVVDAEHQLQNESSVGGNVVVSFAGGTYSISKPIWISGSPNKTLTGLLTIHNGGLVAAESWSLPQNESFLLRGTFYSVNLEDLNLDARHKGGCIQMHMHLQVTIYSVFFNHFSTVGLDTGGGHELLMQFCNFQEYAHAEIKHLPKPPQFTGTAIRVGSSDNQFWDTVVKCCKTGIVTRALNTFAFIHLWPDCANFTLGGYSMIVGHSTRIWGSNMDGSALLITEPQDVHIFDTRLKGAEGSLIIWLNNSLPNGTILVHDVLIEGNSFHCNDFGCPKLMTTGLPPGAANKISLSNVIVRDNYFDNYTQVVGTYADGSTEGQQEHYVIDFSDALLFPVPIDQCHVTYSFQAVGNATGVVPHHYMVRGDSSQQVKVVVNWKGGAPAQGKVYASVDQSTCTAIAKVEDVD